MARATRDSKLESKSDRLAKCPHQKAPYWTSLEPGLKLGYYRPQKGDGSWIARLWISELDHPRQQSTLGTADDHADADGKTRLTYAQAQEKARKWRGRIKAAATGERLQEGPLTVRDAWEDYSEKAQRRGMKGLDRTRNAAELHILPALGAVDVDKLTKRRIEKWHHALSEAPARVRSRFGAKQPATRPAPRTDDEKRARKDTANRVLTILKAMLNHARDEGLTSANGDAWGKAEAFRDTTRARIRFLTAEESQRLANACSPDFRRLVLGALFTGARFGELVRLQVRDFDPKGGTVFIAESKSGKPRHVVLTGEGVAFFEEATTGLLGDRMMFEREAFPDMRRVRPGSQEPIPKVSRAWRKGDQNRFMAAACEAAGLEPVSFHELRHSYASSLINAGVPIAFIAKQLGHSNSVMTEKHYGHLAPSAMAEAIRKLAPKLGIHTPGKVAGLKIKKS